MAIYENVEQVDEDLANFRAALSATSKGQRFSMPDGSVWEPGDQAEIKKTLKFLDKEKRALEGRAGPQITKGVPKR